MYDVKMMYLHIIRNIMLHYLLSDNKLKTYWEKTKV